MVSLEEFYVTWANSALHYNGLMYEFTVDNRKDFGVKDRSLADKIDYLMKGSSSMVDGSLKESINKIENCGMDCLDECLRNKAGGAVGTMQSYVPNFVHMNARVCTRDFGCNFDNLVQSGMKVSKVVDALYLKLMGQRSFIPTFPVPRIIFGENIIDTYYQTDILFTMELARMMPEHKINCALEDTTEEDIMIMMIATSLSPIMIMEYANIVNMLSHRPYYPPNFDWAVTVLSLLEADEEYYSDGTFFAVVPGAESFVKCMIAQSKKAKPFLERLRAILRKG